MTDDLKRLAEAAKAAVEAERRHHHTWEWGLNGDHTPWPSEGARKRFAEAANPDVILALIRERDEARERAERFEKLDREAATHVESVIALRTGFTGEPPYVSWKGLGLALTEALDKRDAAEAALSAAREEVGRLLSAMKREEDYLLRMIEAEDETGGLMISDVQGAFHRIRDKDSDDMAREDEAATLTKEPHHG